MGRPSHFIASTSRVSAKDISDYILWHAKAGKFIDLYCIDREHVLRWLEKNKPYLNRNGDIVSSPREERAGKATVVVSDADIAPDAHIRAYYADRTEALLSKRDRKGPEINVKGWRSGPPDPRWAKIHAENAPKRRGNGGGRKASERKITTDAINALLKGDTLDLERLTKLASKLAK